MPVRCRLGPAGHRKFRAPKSQQRPARALKALRLPIQCTAAPSPEGNGVSSLRPVNIPRVAALTALLVACPAIIPFLASGGGGGPATPLWGYGGGGGGFWQSLLPLARADEDSDSDDEDDEDEDEDDDGMLETEIIVTKDGDDEEEEELDGQVPAGREGEQVSEDVDDESAYMEPPKGVDKSAFFCVGVRAEGLPMGEGVPTEEDLFSSLNCQPGFWVPQEKLKADLKTLLQMGIFKEVDAKVVPVRKGSKSKKMEVRFKFSETFWPPIRSFEVVDSKCLPPDINERVMAQLKKHHDGKPTGLAVLTTIRNVVEGWYGDRGFAYSFMKEFEGLETGHVKVSVNEAKIRSIDVKFVDENFEEKPGGGQTPVSVIKRSISLKPGQYYSLHDGKAALQEAFALQVFDNAQVQPEYVANKEDELDITIMLKERPMQTMDLDLEWPLAPSIPGVPLPVPNTPVPGGTLTFEDRNFQKKANTLTASVMCASFLHPSDDLSLRVSYKHPFIFGTRSDQDLVADAFNSRRLSSVFAAAPGEDAPPPVWVERAGIKVALAENLTRQSKSSLGFVAQEVKTRDDTGALVTEGTKQGPMGSLVPNGPPTTLSGTGVDRFIDLRFNVMRDTTFYNNGGLIGSRDVLDVTQGIGLGNGFFNRYMLSLTRFLKLNTPKSTSVLPPATLVLHGKTGNCIGPLASYDYHVLGGPHSCRAYSLGELGPARHYVEGAAELRVPVPVINKQVFVYGEHAQDLSQGYELAGNPKEFYNRAGSGTSLGAGIKLGALRAEYARDCNRATATWFLHFGERF